MSEVVQPRKTQLELALERQVARWYPLIDHPVQLELVAAVDNGVRFPVVAAGRRCLAKGTLVSTPIGPVAIELLNIGDEVIGFNPDTDAAEICHVTNTFDNGVKPVHKLSIRGKEVFQATSNHKVYACNESDFDKREGREKHIKGYRNMEVSELLKTTRRRVRREYVEHLISGGDVSVPYTYSLGCMLGDGCARDSKATNGNLQKQINISSGDSSVPAAIAKELGCGYRKLPSNNYTYAIDIGEGTIDKIPYYKEWVSMRYSHNKIIDWSVVDTWDKESCFSLLAGLIDTDGSIYFINNNENLKINVGMQALSVIECARNIIFKYFQEELTIRVDCREKYKNGNIYSICSSNNILSSRIINALDGYLHRDRHIGVDLSCLSDSPVKLDRVSLKPSNDTIDVKTYDITVSNDSNLYCLHNNSIIISNSGKTERAKRFLVKRAMAVPGIYFASAPTYNQVKKIYWDDLKQLSLCAAHDRRPSESELKIFLPNGSEIHLIGLDQPSRVEGINWKGGLIDEIADIKAEAWERNIMPALNTVDPRDPDYRAWCWLLGVPDSLDFYYDLAMYAKDSCDSEWAFFTWHSADILPADVIETAKRTMGAKQFRIEYCASFEGSSGRIYDDYDQDNYTDDVIEPDETLYWFHDFNYTPMSSGVGVMRGVDFYLLDEIILTSAVARQSALEFIDKFKNHTNKHVLIYGDPAGRAGEKHGHESDYTEIERILKENGWTYTRKVKRSTRSIKDGQNAVRARIRNAAGEVFLYVNIKNAPYTHKSLLTGQLKAGSTFLEHDTEYQHIGTAIRYLIDYEFPVNSNGITREHI